MSSGCLWDDVQLTVLKWKRFKGLNATGKDPVENGRLDIEERT